MQAQAQQTKLEQHHRHLLERSVRHDHDLAAKARKVQEEQVLRVMAQREARQETSAERAAKLGKKSAPTLVRKGADILKASAQAQEEKKRGHGPIVQAFNAAQAFVNGEKSGDRKLASEEDDHGPFSVIGKAGLHMMHDNQRLRGR